MFKFWQQWKISGVRNGFIQITLFYQQTTLFSLSIIHFVSLSLIFSPSLSISLSHSFSLLLSFSLSLSFFTLKHNRYFFRLPIVCYCVNPCGAGHEKKKIEKNLAYFFYTGCNENGPTTKWTHIGRVGFSVFL